ncbi:type I-E CRISPR-associated protein Cse2/CasB [Deinococcus sp. SL84]|uniref:type I-E CRISPR-associated protein Cse2/CasB n=1 Tax=Deinococcus sp. SL84 TaxID=2994663 RepID=UPI002272A21C|nr:type I-E CRISPR-associated protein Cse2/CasB [Deinococcus sp. SL84]MCY1703557.1 type I-E CRISPR-associated protein Cse2/CasB [Deinococcus sp. SL84]
MTRTRDERQDRFVKELSRLERRELAQLRRGLGGENVYWLGRLFALTGYGEAPNRTKEALQLLASLYALKPQASDDTQGEVTEENPQAKGQERGVSIGFLMAQVHLEQNRKNGRLPSEASSTEKRLLGLLDADWEGISYHLRQAVTLLNAQEQTHDWAELTDDLLALSRSTTSAGRVRTKWAQDFYAEIGKAQAAMQKATEKSAVLTSQSPSAPSTPPLDQPADQDEEGETL